jgi:hypothetical protein
MGNAMRHLPGAGAGADSSPLECLQPARIHLSFSQKHCEVVSIFIILLMDLILYGPEGIHKAVRATCNLQKVPWHSEQLLTGNTMKLKSEGIC